MWWFIIILNLFHIPCLYFNIWLSFFSFSCTFDTLCCSWHEESMRFFSKSDFLSYLIYLFLFCSVSFHCFYHILLLKRSRNYQIKIYVSFYFWVDFCFVHNVDVLSVILSSEQLNHLEQVCSIYVFSLFVYFFYSDLNNHSSLVSPFEELRLFPGPGSGPQLQFVSNSSGPGL